MTYNCPRQAPSTRDARNKQRKDFRSPEDFGSLGIPSAQRIIHPTREAHHDPAAIPSRGTFGGGDPGGRPAPGNPAARRPHPRRRPPADDAAAYRNAVDRAINFLQAKAQAPDGSFSGKMGIGVTAVVTTGILRQGRSPDDPVVARSLKYLAGFVQPDGGIYEPGSFHKNYETSLGVLCFTQANKDGRYKKLLAGADRFLRGVQWDEGEGQEKSSVNYGGAGYGKHKRPDLSNTSFLIDALKAAGSRRGRRGHEEGPGLRLPLPEPGDASTTRRRSPPRTPTAASTTPRPTAAPAWPARRPTAGCAATAR